MTGAALGGILVGCVIFFFRDKVVDFIYMMNRRSKVIISRDVITTRVTIASLFLILVGIFAVLKDTV